MPLDYPDQHERAILLGALAIASILLGAGLVAPLMTIRTLVFLRSSFSVVSGVYDLWADGKYLLFALISLFSIVVPLVKIGLLAAFLTDGGAKRLDLLRLVHDYGRWAMLDVLVVAILIVTVKLGAVASVEVHPGLYIFGAAVLLIMLVTDRVAKLAEAREHRSR